MENSMRKAIHSIILLGIILFIFTFLIAGCTDNPAVRPYKSPYLNTNPHGEPHYPGPQGQPIYPDKIIYYPDGFAYCPEYHYYFDYREYQYRN